MDLQQFQKVIIDEFNSISIWKKKADNLRKDWTTMEKECGKLATPDERKKCFEEKKAVLKNRIKKAISKKLLTKAA